MCNFFRKRKLIKVVEGSTLAISEIGTMKNDMDSNCPIDLNKFSWIRQYAPCFRMQPDQVDIIYEPKDFYNKIKVKFNFKPINFSNFNLTKKFSP